MTTDIDEKLTTLEQLMQLLDAGHVVVLRKDAAGFRIAAAADRTHDHDEQMPTDILLEGLAFGKEYSIESATGRCLADVVRAVVTLHDLPY